MDVLASLCNLLDRFYPPCCLLCGCSDSEITGKHLDLCLYCYQSLPFNKVFCSVCALPLSEPSSKATTCGRCLKKTPEFDYSLSVLRYEQPVLWLVQQLKFNQRLVHSRPLGEMMRDKAMIHISTLGLAPQCILPVPLSRKRLRERGFNQSIELAKPLAKVMCIPLLCNAVKRTRHTSPQTGLDAKQRRKNIKGAFQLVKAIPFDHVLIVDDVVTTGTTVNELARVLKKAGVKTVGVLSVARTPVQ